jgi:iron(III) transport system substrate-binding protein
MKRCFHPVVLAGVCLLAACGSSAAPSAPPSTAAPASVSAAGGATAKPASPAASGKPAAGQDWSAVVDAAKKEGVVQCACPPRPDYAKLLKENFEKDVPGIKLQTEAAALPQFWTTVDKEQQAGQYNWDIYMFGPTIEMFGLKDKGAFESFRDYMAGPDIGTDADWEGGLNAEFLDKDKKFIFAFWRSIVGNISINRDALPQATIRTYDQLADPAYKGKIVTVDPRAGGSGVNFFTDVYHFKGREGLQKLLIDQQTMFVKGVQEQADQAVRGGHPISLTQLQPDSLVQFKQAGVKVNLENVNLDDLPAVSNAGLAPAVFKKPVHPNATKVFINWLLSPATQQLLSSSLNQNTTRKGVPVAYPQTMPQPSVTYYHTQTEEAMTKDAVEMQKIARELVP